MKVTKAGSGLIIMLVLIFSVNMMYKIHHEEEAIKEKILNGYVHGAFNELNPEAMTDTFHEDFAIFSPNGEDIRKYPISTWVESTRERKADPEFKAEDNVWEHKFKKVDVSGHAAAVELELYRNGDHVFTDYLSLLKFDNGWKVVAKVYYRHEN